MGVGGGPCTRRARRLSKTLHPPELNVHVVSSSVPHLPSSPRRGNINALALQVDRNNYSPCWYDLVDFHLLRCISTFCVDCGSETDYSQSLVTVTFSGTFSQPSSGDLDLEPGKPDR